MKMPTKAIILFSDNSEDNEILKWCTKESASIPLYKRAILSAQKAGVKKLFFLGCHIKEKIETSIKTDKQINADIKWYDKKIYTCLDKVITNELAEKANERFFIIRANTLFDYRILSRLSRASSINTVATIAINNATRISVKNNNANNSYANSEIQDKLNGGIIIATHRITDFLTSVNEKFSFKSLIKRLSKENFIKTVDAKEYLYEEINSQASLLLAERKLYQSLGTSLDSPVIDKFILRKLSGFISKLFLRTSLTPNQVTIIGLILGLLSGLLFSFGGYTYNISAGLIFFLSVVFDQSDGEMARLKYMESEFGRILDIISDTIVHAAVVAGITYSVYKTVGSDFIIGLGLLAMFGISISVLLTTYFDHKKKKGEKLNDEIKELLDKLNNKDFFYVLIFVCIIINQMIWVLWMMAIGTCIYWITRKIVYSLR